MRGCGDTPQQCLALSAVLLQRCCSALAVLQVAAADPQAAYQLAAATARGLALWDLRAGGAAAAELPAPAMARAMLLPLPGGDLLLAAHVDGQVALYDVRRLSSSSIINFGSSRTSQQLFASFNLRARAQAAGDWGSSSSSFSVDDIALNPADANLLAYGCSGLQVRWEEAAQGRFARRGEHSQTQTEAVLFRASYTVPAANNQVGVFDMYSNKVVQQVSLLELQPPAPAAIAGSAAQQASLLQMQAARVSGARVSWDSTGRTLFGHGLLQRPAAADSSGSIRGDAGLCFTPTLAAVDWGSLHGAQQRRLAAATADDDAAAAVSDADPGVPGQEQDAGGQGAGLTTSSSSSSVARASNGGVLCQGGQVVHMELHRHVAPTELAAGGGTAAGLLVGTASGDVMWLV
jgi:hypothetical protein